MRLIDANSLMKALHNTTLYDGCDRSIIYRTIEEEPTVQIEQCWIPANEELPNPDTIVLVCGKNGGIYTAIYNNTKANWSGWWKMNAKNHHCEPLAWMPLPEVYKEN